MPVSGYIIHKRPEASNLPRQLPASTGPYLFRSEAESFAQVITDDTGIDCHISIIPVQRLLNQEVMVDDEMLVTSIWEIAAKDDGFCGKAFIEGHIYLTYRTGSDQSWRVVREPQNDSSDQYLTLVA